MVNDVVVEPPGLDAVMVYVLSVAAAVGFPEMIPVAVLNDNPLGSE